MEDQIIGTLTINTSVTIPSVDNLKSNGHVIVREYRNKTVKLHTYYGVERSKVPQLKGHFLDKNPELEEFNLSFVFQVTEYF